MTKHKAILSAGLSCILALTPCIARADANCDELFASMRQHLSADSRHYFSVNLTTNYLTKEWRFMSWGGIREFRQRAQDLAGEGTRTKYQTRLSTGIGPTVTENIALRICHDGKVVLNDVYGPYDPVCPKQPGAEWPKHGYVVLYAGDSIEVFNFYREITSPGQLR